MKIKYNRAIEHIKVTPGMHERIMKNLSDIDIVKKQRKVPFFRVYRKYISFAACLVLMFVGAFVVYNSLTNSNNPPVATNSSIVDCGSLGELSDAVGFKVQEVKTLPFKVKETAYASFWGKLAQIKYTDEENILVFRMSVGSEDNSGVYDEYSDVKNCSAGDYTVTIKGTSGLYNIAIWENGRFSYSINISNGVSEEEMQKIVLSVQQ